MHRTPRAGTPRRRRQPSFLLSFLLLPFLDLLPAPRRIEDLPLSEGQPASRDNAGQRTPARETLGRRRQALAAAGPTPDDVTMTCALCGRVRTLTSYPLAGMQTA